MNKIFGTMKNRFILSVMLPLTIITLLSFNIGLWKFGIFMCILFLDGLFGILRVNKHIKDKKKFHMSDMKIIENKLIPFGGILLFGTLFTKLIPSKLTDRYKEHEMTHMVQGFETGYILMYFIYLLEGLFWTIKLTITFSEWHFTEGIKWHQRIKEALFKAYTHICFEQEARCGEIYDDYKNRRLWYAWLPFLFNDNDSNTNLELLQEC